MHIPPKIVYWAIILFVVFFLYKGGFLKKKIVQPVNIGVFSYQDSDLLLYHDNP